MKVLILGDTHGEWAALNFLVGKALNEHPDISHIIQVGDFGYAWPGTKPFKFSRSYFADEQLDYLASIPKWWLDGNHENYNKLLQDSGASQPGWEWMPRGKVMEVDGYRMMFFGGATSHDKASRIEGHSWWPEESISYAQVMNSLGADHSRIDAIFSHEHPTSIPYSDNRYSKENITGKSDKDALQALREKYDPKFWFFGHHHRGDSKMEGDMLWTCCPIVDDGKPPCYTIWTGETVDRYWSRERRKDERKRKPFIT